MMDIRQKEKQVERLNQRAIDSPFVYWHA